MVSERLAGGESAAGISGARCVRCPHAPPSASSRRSPRTDPARLRAALGVLADLEQDSRGGSPLPAARGPENGLEEDSLAMRAVEAIAS